MLNEQNPFKLVGRTNPWYKKNNNNKKLEQQWWFYNKTLFAEDRLLLERVYWTNNNTGPAYTVHHVQQSNDVQMSYTFLQNVHSTLWKFIENAEIIEQKAQSDMCDIFEIKRSWDLERTNLEL